MDSIQQHESNPNAYRFWEKSTIGNPNIIFYNFREIDYTNGTTTLFSGSIIDNGVQTYNSNRKITIVISPSEPIYEYSQKFLKLVESEKDKITSKPKYK